MCAEEFLNPLHPPGAPAEEGTGAPAEQGHLLAKDADQARVGATLDSLAPLIKHKLSTGDLIITHLTGPEGT